MSVVTAADRRGKSDSLGRFRDKFRSWLAVNLPAEWCRPAFPAINPPGEEDPAGVAISRAWQRVLYEGGWAAPGWPVEYGGRGLDIAQQLVVAEELAFARAPVPIGFQAVELLAPTLIQHATEEQKRRFLPRIRSGDDIWCQGYSEPDAGSDLASLRTTAVSDGHAFVVSGQKIWTSFGHRANWCFLLARTGELEARHRAISFFVVSMDTPGIEWRPIVEITGSEDFGELFLDEVRIPTEQLIGAEGDGWRIAMSSLGHERLLATNTAHVQIRFEALVDLSRRQGVSPSGRDRITTCKMRLLGLRGLQQRALELAVANDPRFPVWSSMVKLAGTELRRDIAELATQILGVRASVGLVYGRPLDGGDEATAWTHELLHSRAATIYAGSSEIQRNIIGERGLNLPREKP